MRYLRILTILLIGVLALAACGEQLPTAEEIVERMEQARAEMDDLHAVASIEFSSAEESGSMRIEGWMQRTDDTDAAGNPISRIRAEVLESSEPKLVGSLIVSDGTTFWLYSPSENTVVTGNTDEMKDAVEQGPAGATAMLQDIVQQGLDAVDLEVTGSEQVAGKDTWVVKVTPKEDTSAQLQLDGVIEGMMWIDEELALPLKLTLDASDFGNGGLEVETIEVNSGLSADIFTFTPPADATIVDAADIAAEMQPRAATIEEARSSVSFTLLEPTYLPAGTALIEVRVIGTSTVILNYGGADASLSLVQSNAETGAEREPPAGSEVTPVTVRGVEGTLIIGPNGEGSLLRWEENGIRYVIAGTLSGDEALNVAEGLE